MQSRILAQNLIAGSEWSKNDCPGLTQHISSALDYDVSVFLKQLISFDSPSSIKLALTVDFFLRAALSSYDDSELKLLVTNCLIDES